MDLPDQVQQILRRLRGDPEPSGLRCPACGHPNPPVNRFCVMCAAPLSADSPAGDGMPAGGGLPTGGGMPGPAVIPATQSVCPACGERAEPGLRFCTHCGTALPATVSAPAAAPGRRPPVPAEAPPAAGGSARTCRVCGALNTDDSPFCYTCGAPMAGPGLTTQPPVAAPGEAISGQQHDDGRRAGSRHGPEQSPLRHQEEVQRDVQNQPGK
ncbi:MAG: zinc ribbon domain-containing protein, partial [Clostridiales bacterium]|nr:zinc ribbon domain-containing protein [Clostridiales bacterium]